MGPKPTMNDSQLASARTLNNLRANIALPPPLYSRIFSAHLDDQIHLFAMGALPGETRHVVLDETGEIVNEGTTLPKIQVEGIAVCKDEIILINGQPEADRLQLFAFDKHSTMKWKFELPVARSEARYPDLCCPPDRLQVIWLVGRDPAVLWLTEVDSGVGSSPLSITLAETTHEVKAIPAQLGLTLTRLRGAKLKPEIIHLANAKVVRQAPVAAVEGAASVRLALIGDQYALMWLTTSSTELYLQCFDWSLDPITSPERLVSTDGATKLLSMQFIWNDLGQLLISYIEESDGGGWAATDSDRRRGTRYQRRRVYRQFIAPYDWRTNTLADFQQVSPAGLPYNTWSWIGDKLFLVHGDQSPTLSIYQIGQ